jgi:hypothetical protein
MATRDWREVAASEFVEKGTRIAKFMGTRDSVFQMVRMLLENNETPHPLETSSGDVGTEKRVGT